MLAVLPLTGNLAVIGVPKREAMELALEKGRAAFPGVKLTIDYQDSQGMPKEAISIINQALALRRPDLLFVDLTPVVDATIPLADASKIPMFAGSAQAGITARSPAVFRVFPGGDQEVRLLTDFLRRQPNSGVFALHPNELYGRSVRKALEAQRTSITLLGAEEYGLGDRDFRPQLIKARESGAAIIVLLGYGSEYATLLRQAAEVGIPASRIVANLGAVNTGVLQLPPELTDGMTFVGPAFALRANDSAPPEQRELVTAYQQKYQRAPDFRVAFVYDTVMLLQQALQSAGSVEQLSTRLTSTRDYAGASGRISLGETRDAAVEMVLGRYQGGRPVPLSNP